MGKKLFLQSAWSSVRHPAKSALATYSKPGRRTQYGSKSGSLNAKQFNSSTELRRYVTGFKKKFMVIQIMFQEGNPIMSSTLFHNK